MLGFLPARSAVGMIIAAMYLLIMVGKIVFGLLREPAGHGHGAHADDEHSALPADLTGREIGILSVLAIGCVVLGVYPTPVIRTIEAPIAQTLGTIENARGAAPVFGATELTGGVGATQRHELGGEAR